MEINTPQRFNNKYAMYIMVLTDVIVSWIGAPLHVRFSL